MKAQAYVLAVVAALSPMTTSAQEAPAAAPGALDATVENDPRAVEVMDGMAKFLAAQPSFAFTATTGYDAPQDDGRSLEFGDVRRVSVRRPDRLRIDVVASDGKRSYVYYDGRELVAYDEDARVYAKSKAPETLDRAIAYYVTTLGMRLPLAALLRSRVHEDFERRFRAYEYVETSSICHVPCHHVAARTHNTDVEAWIADGDAPLPLRVLITYRNDPGRPQFRAVLSDWRLGAAFPDSHFAFQPPEGATGIPFAAEAARTRPVAAAGETP